MRCRVAFSIFFFCLFAHQLLARPSKSARRVTSDPAYRSALATANRFLHAWQTQDHETGIMMLSDAARQRVSPDQLQEFFSPTASAAFEIEHGKRLNAGEYAFPVVLFGLTGSHDRAHICRIVVTRAGRDDWEVDKLP
jgi:hypothetical protein